MSETSVGRPSGSLNKMPKNLPRVRDVLRRRADNESWTQIGKAHGITRAGARLLHNRWRGVELPIE